MPTPCLCGQAASAPVCSIAAGAGIQVSGGSPNFISAISGNPWVAFTPTVANFTLGNALNSSRYRLNGKTIDVIWLIQFGTTSTYTATEWGFALPGGAVAFFDANGIMSGHERSGDASLKDVSAGSPWFEAEPVLVNAANPVRVRFGDDAGGIAATSMLKQGTPFTFTTGDQLAISIFGIELV
jgi:hypothetical protein